MLAITLFQAGALAPLVPLVDALSLARARPRPNMAGFEYGWVRGVGSAAFVAGTLVAGHAADDYGLSAIMWLTAATLAIPFAAKLVPAFSEGSEGRLFHQERPDRPGCYYFASQRLGASLWSARSFSAVTRCMTPLP